MRSLQWYKRGAAYNLPERLAGDFQIENQPERLAGDFQIENQPERLAEDFLIVR